MSQLGQTRRFDRPLLTSGLTPETDIQLIRWHVSTVPEGDINTCLLTT
jgi:hypothetical protein